MSIIGVLADRRWKTGQLDRAYRAIASRNVHAVDCDDAGKLRWTTVPDPVPGPGEVVIEVAATAVNRADLLQRRGLYPPPPGASEILGLECSGVIRELGPQISRWSVGDPVCALLAGGGYAERVAVPAGQVMPVPGGVDLVTAAALPEAVCTVWSNLVDVARLRRGESVLVHGGAGGVGSFAVQIAKALGAEPVMATAGGPEKCRVCLDLGVDVAIDYRSEDFPDRVRELTGGADVILDVIGAKYLARNLDALADDGRLVIIGLQGGARAEIDLGGLLRRRAAVHATTLRARPLAQKAAICQAVADHVWPMLAAGEVRPLIHARIPLTQAAEAHRIVESGGHVGKVVLTRP